MSSIGSSTATVVVDEVRRTMEIRGNNWSRQGVTLNFSGLVSGPTDLVLVAYRKGIFCGGISAGSITGTLPTASGALDTNTEEFELTMVGLRFGDVAPVELQLWNSNAGSLELLGVGTLELKCSGPGYTVSTGATPATPLVGSTGSVGAFGWKDGKTYFRNDDIAGPANWFPVSLQGPAGSMFIDYSQPGEALV